MYNIYLIKRSFIRQSSQDTCGVACLGMIFNFSGNHQLVRDLENIPVKEGGLSLYEMQALAFKYGYSTRSVEMEMTYLRHLKVPCILHTQTAHGEYHYQVCYGCRLAGESYQYLMADPARQVYYIEEEELKKTWVSKAALFFDNLKMDLSAFQVSPWAALLTLGGFPAGFWVVIPALTLCAASFGVALSWVLQKGITNSYFLKANIFIAIVILLFLISVAKSLFAFLRQYLLIRLNMSVNQKLMTRFIRYIFDGGANAIHTKTPFNIRNNLKDIQKIQYATSEFLATVLSEGSLLLIFLSAIAFLLPLAALINVFYLIIIGWFTYKGLALNSFYTAHLSHLSATTETFILQDLDFVTHKGYNHNIANQLKFHESNHELSISQTRQVAIKASIQALYNEILGTVNLIAVFTISLLQLQSEKLDYGTFMLLVILSYLISALVPKICNALAVIADGADAAILHQTVRSSS